MRTLRLAGAIIILVLASPALAQFNAPIRYNEGPGIKLSDSLVFHPGADIEGRYDSNALYTENNPTSAAYMRFIGRIDLATLSKQRLTDTEGAVSPRTLDFRLRSAVAFREYLSGNDYVRAQRALEVDAGFLLAVFPERVFSFDVADDYARTVTARFGETLDTLSRDINRAALKLKFAPGGGRLSFGVGYSMNIDIFENRDYAGANKYFHEVSAFAKWKILPKTAITLDVIEQFINYYDPRGGLWANLVFDNHNSYPIRAYAGLVGLITPQLSTILKIGYGNGIFNSGPSYNNVLAIAELGYQFGPFAKFRLGYEHLFLDAMWSNYYTDEKVYLGYDHFIASRVILHLIGDYRYRTYTGFPATANTTEDITQHVFGFSFGADYQVKEWFFVGLGYDLTSQNRISGPEILDFGGTLSLKPLPNFTKHQIFAKVSISY